jgi:glutamyl-tRNA synthetase
LHIGGARTAFNNFLFAKRHGGKFLVRIEDTDAERSLDSYTQDIFASLKWLFMEAEEPVLYQSKRLPIYQSVADQMIKDGLAYRCYCTEAEVEATREQMMKDGKKPMYARTCRDRTEPLPGRTSFAVRAKFPLTGTTSFTDMIRKEITFPNEDLDDFVMVRSSGMPTYNFVVVIDDIEMQISHVIRGDDHINNTPKQVFLYEALKKTKPLFAHLPVILGQDKKKLSKRDGVAATNAYRTEGFLPEALLNFLVRLGWSHGDQEIFTLEEMIGLFDFEHVQISGAVFNVEKLMWIQGEHMKKADPARLMSIVKSDFKDKFNEHTFALLDGPYAKALLPHVQQKVKLIKELAEQLQPLLEPGVATVDASTLKWNKDPEQKAKIKEAIQAVRTEIAAKMSGKTYPSEAGFDHAGVDAMLRGTSEKFGLKLGDLTAPMRLFVTGQAVSAVGLFDLIPAMPWETASARLDACLNS